MAKKVVKYGATGYMGCANKFMVYGSRSPELDKQYKAELAKLDVAMLMLNGMSAHAGIALVRRLNQHVEAALGIVLPT